MVLEHTVGALITRFASKYIDNLDLSALRLSVFGGDVVLRNLELNLEVLRRDFAAGLPIEFQRGYVREIRIHIPWLKLASEPIELTIDTVELVASLLPPDTASGRSEAPDSSGASAEAPAELGGGSASADGWMGPLLTKALFNMSVRKPPRALCSVQPTVQQCTVQPSPQQSASPHLTPGTQVVVRNVVVKFVEERAVASLSLRSIEVHSAGAQWQRACVEPEGPSKRLRKTVTLPVETKRAQASASWHRPRLAGSLEAAFSARACLRLTQAPASRGHQPLGPSWPTISGLLFDTGDALGPDPLPRRAREGLEPRGALPAPAAAPRLARGAYRHAPAALRAARRRDDSAA